MWNLKNDKNENSCKTETHRFQKTNLWSPKGMVGESGNKLGIWD